MSFTRVNHCPRHQYSHIYSPNHQWSCEIISTDPLWLCYLPFGMGRFFILGITFEPKNWSYIMIKKFHVKVVVFSIMTSLRTLSLMHNIMAFWALSISLSSLVVFGMQALIHHPTMLQYISLKLIFLASSLSKT